MRRLGVALVVVLALAGCTTPTPEPEETVGPPVAEVPGPDLPFGGDCSTVLGVATASDAVGIDVVLTDLNALFRHSLAPEALAPEAAGSLLCDWNAEGEIAGWVTVVASPASAVDARDQSFSCIHPSDNIDEGGTLSCSSAFTTNGVWVSLVLGGATGLSEAEYRAGADSITAEISALAVTLASVPEAPAPIAARTCSDFADVPAAVDSPSLIAKPYSGIENAPIGYGDALAAAGFLGCSWEPSGDTAAEGELDGFLFTTIADAAWAESRVQAAGATTLRLEGVDAAYLVSDDDIDTVHAFVGSTWISVEDYGSDPVSILPAVQAIAADLG